MARPSSTARRYAEAVWEIAQRDGTEDAWQVALQAAAAALGHEDVLRIVENPAIPLQGRLRAVTSALDATALGSTSVQQQLGNFVRLLVERRRVELLVAISRQYDRLLDRQRGVVEAIVTSATRLSDDETAAIAARVEAMTGSTVSLRSEIDPSLIGGLTVRVGDRLLDASIRGRLERLRSQLLAGSRQPHGTGA